MVYNARFCLSVEVNCRPQKHVSVGLCCCWSQVWNPGCVCKVRTRRHETTSARELVHRLSLVHEEGLPMPVRKRVKRKSLPRPPHAGHWFVETFSHNTCIFYICSALVFKTELINLKPRQRFSEGIRLRASLDRSWSPPGIYSKVSNLD
jgi:hypothetical protein